jgi:hypothetical protein
MAIGTKAGFRLAGAGFSPAKAGASQDQILF